MNLNILYQWTAELEMHFSSLNSWQVDNLALFSYGVVLSENSQQMSIARKVVCGEQTASAERRLRRFINNPSWSVESVSREWTQWVVSRLETDKLVLLVDETKLGSRLAIMMVGVAYEGRCIPLAWRCYKANSKEDYPAEGQVEMIVGLLHLIQSALADDDRPVLLLADRGIGTSPALCKRVDEMGWQYLFRITKQSKIITDEGEYTIYDQVQEGDIWQASGLVFKKRGRIPAHARAFWADGYDEPWVLVTNDADLTGHEYAQRNWQEQSFRDLKSGGWQWSQSRVWCPEHMARFIAILVVAYGWILGIGSYAIHWHRARSLSQEQDGQRRRQWSVFKEGLQWFTDYVLRENVCLTPCFVSDKRLC